MIALGEKIDEAREQMPEEALVIEYDNGGGQCGIRENPFWSAYRKILLEYIKSLSLLAEMLDGTKPPSDGTLEYFRARIGLSKYSLSEYGKKTLSDI